MPLGNVSKGKIQSWDFFFFTKWKESGGNWFQQDKTQTKEGLGTDKNLKEWGFSTDDIRRFIFFWLWAWVTTQELWEQGKVPSPGKDKGFSAGISAAQKLGASSNGMQLWAWRRRLWLPFSSWAACLEAGERLLRSCRRKCPWCSPRLEGRTSPVKRPWHISHNKAPRKPQILSQTPH